MLKSNINSTQPFKGYYTLIHRNESNPARIGTPHGIPYASNDFVDSGKILAERVYVAPKLEDKFEAAIDNSSYEIHHKANDNEYPDLDSYSRMALDLLMHYPFVKKQLDGSLRNSIVGNLGTGQKD